MSDIQITKKFGQFSVTALDSNGVRVQVEPGQCTFATREEAQEYVNRWLDVTADLVQIADGESEYGLRVTASGYAVTRGDGSYAEFLGSEEAEEAAEMLAKGEKSDNDYEWNE